MTTRLLPNSSAMQNAAVPPSHPKDICSIMNMAYADPAKTIGQRAWLKTINFSEMFLLTGSWLNDV